MVLIAFLIDTSASMYQKTCLGISYLDLAKGAVESFIKIRTRDPSAKGDRYMLITYDEYTKSVKAGWKGVNLQMFMTELKNLDGLNLSDVGRALKETFDLLNVNRLHTGVDNYGLGRNPFYLEPAIILLLTDGCLPMDSNGILKEIAIPRHDLLPGAELTKELYRWDQRLFTLQLKIPGFAQPVCEKHITITSDDIQLSTLCDQTGGKLYNIGGYKQLIQSLESIAQKMTIPGVVVNFMKHGPDPDGLIENVKPDENTYHGIGDIKDIHHVNGKIDKQLSSIFSDQSNFFGNNPHGGINGFVNGQDILASPLNKNYNKTRIINGDIDINPPLKTEGLSTSEVAIPNTPIRGAEEAENVFSPSPATLTTTWYNQHKMIYVRSNPKAGKGNVCHWPIPESFWPDPAATKIPPRDCHPIIRFTCKPVDAVVGSLKFNLPFDKYELEPSPLTQFILEKRQCNTAWQAFIKGSSQSSEIGFPFGYLKASTNFQTVNLFVLPYNYPVLIPLLDELFQIHNCKPTVGWKQSFQDYLQTVPSYYYDPIRNALNSMKVSANLIPDHLTGTLSYSVSSYLKKLKHEAKARADRYLQQKKEPETFPAAEIPRVPQLIDGKLRDFKELLIRNSSSVKKKTKDNQSIINGEKTFERRKLPTGASKKFSWETYRNPFDIRHGNIINHVHQMRKQFFHMSASSSVNSDKSLADEEKRHDVAITAMGNFLEHIQQKKSLREVDPSQVRIHTFGNPFKLKQQDQHDQFIAVDEADVNENLPIHAAPNHRKRPSGDMLVALQKGKRKRNETPPPSRKPVGRPNVPPAKPMTIRYAPDSKGILKDLNGALDKNAGDADVQDNGISKKPSNIVSKQLRKLQEMHRSKKEIVDLLHTTDNNSSSVSDEIEQIESQSPILSILRTSLEESDERDNDEVSQINDRRSDTSAYLDDDENSNDSTSTTRSTPSNLISPSSSSKQILSPLLMEDMFKNMPEDQLKIVYKELHMRKVIKVRQSVWQALRERKKFSVIKDMVKSLSVSTETKYMFVMNLIYETKRFQAAQVEEDLKTLLREIQAIKCS